MRKLLTWSIFTVLMALLLAPPHSAAQTQFSTVSGRVNDNTGATVPDAKVTLTNTGTNARWQTPTNADGLYVIANVPAGKYDIAIEKQNFRKVTQHVNVGVAENLTLNFTLEVGPMTETLTVTESAVSINLTSGDLSKTISSTDLENLPNLTRNPYALVALAPGAVDSGNANGDGRGLGIAVAGGRTSSISFLLDGAENIETFSVGVGTNVPMDAVAEFRVQTNNMSAEFGRNPLVTNVITKSGSNDFHGSVYEFYRGSALSSAAFDDNAKQVPKSRFVRNLFGATAGGKIWRDKTFYFGSFEGLRVRSSKNNFWFVPTQAFVDNSSPAMKAYVTGFGGLPSNLGSTCMTAANVVARSGVPAGVYGSDPAHSLFRSGTATLIPSNTNLFCLTATQVPLDAGGGAAQDTWSYVAKVDHHFTSSTSLSARIAFQDQKQPTGANADSPFTQFQTPATYRSQGYTLTLTHSFSPRIFSETRASYSRTNPQAPLGAGPVTAPCIQYQQLGNTPTGDAIVFPGYLPDQCGAFALPSGGPQNTYTGFTGYTWSRGRQTFKWGAYASHLRDNHTFGAFATGNGSIATPQHLLDGLVDSDFSVAIDPKGRFPGDTYSQATDGPVVPPSFTRHYHYNEVAFYGEDQIKLTSRITATLGLRWEYFGVLHSPNEERFLDANLYLDAVGTPKELNPGKTFVEQVRDARFTRTNNFFNQNFGNFGPRGGVAWDIFGNHRTVFRGGYGIYYDKNFGNALYNAIQNFPNYAVLTTLAPFPTGPTGSVDPNQYVLFGNLAGSGSFPISGSARMLNRDMKTAYTEQWNFTVEHDIFGKGVIASLSYIGANGINLYSLNNINPRGGCLLFPTPCSAAVSAGGNASRPNSSGITNMNRRANEGFSRYNGMNVEVRTRQIGQTGLTVNGAYTWAHSLDNASSFFNDSAFDTTGFFGFRDAFNPALDKANSSNDIRHRFSVSYNWAVPLGKNMTGVGRQVFGGWNLSGIYVAQTGGTFTVYNLPRAQSSQCGRNGTANSCYPVLVGSVPAMDGVTSTGPNAFSLYNLGTVLRTQGDVCGANIACTANLYILHPQSLSPRNLFRLPGYWNWDLGLLKDFPVRERMKLQFRAEFFNLPNHSNLYGDPNTNKVSDGNSPSSPSIVNAKRGVKPGSSVFGVAKDRRNIQLALRLNW